MNRRTSALITFAGLAAAVLAFALFGPIEAGIVAIATLCHAAFGTSIVGTSLIPPGTDVDPRDVRRFRREHPEATIREAAAAVARRP